MNDQMPHISSGPFNPDVRPLEFSQGGAPQNLYESYQLVYIVAEIPSAPPKQEFYLQNRRRISNIRELYDELELMSAEQFRKFVSEDYNHFATWIEHSLNSKFLARRVRIARTKEQIRKELFMAMHM